MKKLLILLIIFSAFGQLKAQEIPSSAENLSHLLTFSKSAPSFWGDDDNVSIFFMLVPKSYTKTVYLKIFDPDNGGKLDQKNGNFNSRTNFSVYSGKNCYSAKEARRVNPRGNYKTGNLVKSKSYGINELTDEKWELFCAVNPTEGEYVEEFDGYVFKVICEGLEGDDGNHYKYFLSSEKENNVPVPGGNGFTYEYSFQLKQEKGSVAHIYPYIDSKVDKITLYNFDFDNDGVIQVYSSKKNGHKQNGSGDDDWKSSQIIVEETERNKSMDIQIVKANDSSNDMVFYAVNQYNEPVPFFASPIGGKPRYQFKIDSSLSKFSKL